MIKFDGMKAEQTSNKYPMLPEGPYVATIKAVKIDGQAPDRSLILRMEIAEGEYKDYFQQRYQAESQGNGMFPAKYKGDFRLRIPDSNNTKDQYPTTTIRRFNDALWRIENSNSGYRFEGDENTLVGKTVGINMQLGTYNDAEYTTIGRLEIADDVRAGKVKPMKHKQPRYSDDHQPASDVPAGYTPVSNADIPF